MTVLAPYIYSWSKNDRENFKVSNLQDMQSLGLRNAVLAFLTTDRYDEIETWVDEIKSFKGNVILSLGGANGEYPSKDLSVNEESKKLTDLLIKTGIRTIDLDIEGDEINNERSINKWISIIQKAQYRFCKDRNTLNVILTLPVEYNYGYDASCLKIIEKFKMARIKICFYNIMLMDYYTSKPIGSNWGTENINIINSVHSQLSKIYHSYSSAKIWRIMGICPMIGYNDDGSTLTLADWIRILQYAHFRDIGYVSFWAINRDQKAPENKAVPTHFGGEDGGDVYGHSFAQTEDYEFCKTAIKLLRN